MDASRKQTICLVDGSGYIFRAFYALPPMTRPDGTPVNAVYGFLNMLMQLVSERGCQHIVVVFDAARRNFRNNIYPAYKETRKEVPPELIPQFPLIRETCRLLNIPQIEMEGYEADDLIATYARIAREKGWQVQIISADKDLMQLMRDGVTLYDPMKRKELTNDDVIAKFGVLPDKVTDVQSFMGDSTDNVPGAAGIGPKTAAELINQFGSVAGVFENLHKIKSEKRRAGLERDKELVLISQKLVQLDTHVPVKTQPEEFTVQIPQAEALFQFLSENNFKSLVNKVKNWLHKQSDFLEMFATPQTDIESHDSFSNNADTNNHPQNDIVQTSEKNQTEPETPSKTAPIKPLFNNEPETCFIQTNEEWQNLYHKILIQKEVAFQIDILDENDASYSIALTLSGNKSFYLTVHQTQQTPKTDLFDFHATKLTENKPDYETIIPQIKEILANAQIHKISFDIKKQLHYLYHNDNEIPNVQNYDDVLIQNYIINGTIDGQTIQNIVQREFNYILPTLPEIKKRKGIVYEQPTTEQYCDVKTNEIAFIFRLFYLFQEKTQNNPVYQTIDLPLIPILFKMEKAGILIDKLHLITLNGLFTQEINQLINKIYELAGSEFNINSPAQISDILFNKLGLKADKKNAGGSLSTNVSVLEKLAEDGNKIADLILQYRMFVKLKSTYVDSLLNLADYKQRVHTTFLQTITNTGRLSSVDPNLQNIPIRTAAGKEIRKAFIARKGYQLVCADYSQIELRLMADVANVKQLKESFIRNEDIHARTASQMFKIPLNQIDSDTRRRAKAINFGIIYGISAFGLSNQLGISRSDSKNYIDAYFAHYPEIKQYMEKMENEVKTNGYVSTPLGRKVFIPGIHHPKTKAFAVRAAINAPIQGGAADIIKRAMIDVQNALEYTGYDATLLLQVHDELVFEVKEKDVIPVMDIIKNKMENAVSLSIPLIADVSAGYNWKEAH